VLLLLLLPLLLLLLTIPADQQCCAVVCLYQGSHQLSSGTDGIQSHGFQGKPTPTSDSAAVTFLLSPMCHLSWQKVPRYSLISSISRPANN
jgi:hypothetical protein